MNECVLACMNECMMECMMECMNECMNDRPTKRLVIFSYVFLYMMWVLLCTLLAQCCAHYLTRFAQYLTNLILTTRLSVYYYLRHTERPLHRCMYLLLLPHLPTMQLWQLHLCNVLRSFDLIMNYIYVHGSNPYAGDRSQAAFVKKPTESSV